MADKAEILSEEEVDFLLAAQKAVDPVAAAPSIDEQAVTMRGDLDQINLADIFQTLGMSKMEGVMRLRNPLDERHVYVKDGQLRAHVPTRLATRRLGQRLVNAGLVQEDHLRAALIAQRTDKRPIGQLLIAAGHCAREVIDEIVGAQIAEDVFALFTWRHGTFEFFKGTPGEAMLQVFAACPTYEISSLLLEVARRSDEWQSILEALVNLDDVPHVVRDPSDDDQLSPLGLEVIRAANGKSTWREIANHTTHGMFEVARAARDLVHAGLLANLDEAALLQLAVADAEAGHPKRALVLMQTLRDRPGDRPIGLLQTMSQALAKIGEKRLAGTLLLEAAQRHSDSNTAIELARSAREMSPHDVGTLSFLRTVLIAHSPGHSPELEKCTLDLLDAMIDADLVPTALDIIEDARRTSTTQPAILLREVRARQKARDADGACRVLEELALLHDQRLEPRQALEAYEALLRIDRSRKDIQKLVATRRRTRVGQIIRISTAAAVLAMVSGAGVVYWQQQQFAGQLKAADAEVSKLLAAGDHAGARARFLAWQSDLGACDAIDDLANRVAFAEAAEAGRQQKLWRERLNASLAGAGESMQRGEVAKALTVYAELANDAKATTEVAAIAQTRVDAWLDEIAQTTKSLQSRNVRDPASMLDRQDLQRGRTDFESICPPRVLNAFHEFMQMEQHSQLQTLLGEERMARFAKVLADGKTAFGRARDIATAYAGALARSDQQRELDPLFKAAVESERTMDFAGALTHYRELERRSTDDASMRGHFRDRVARNATIVRLLEALRAATEAGDFATAQQQLRALRLAFADVPFDRIARLPLRIVSHPAGATVLCNGRNVGATPLILPRLPADVLELEIAQDGFRRAQCTVSGDEPEGWVTHLTLTPDRTWKLDSLVEVAPLRAGDETILVDRGGNVTAYDAADKPRWCFRSGDLSGLLTTPKRHGELLYVASLDGDLRALSLADGSLVWSMSDMPTEVPPILREDRLFLASTDKRLHVVDLKQRSRQTFELPQVPTGLVQGHGSTICVLGDGGLLTAFDPREKQPVWQRELAARAAPRMHTHPLAIVVAGDSGQVVAVAPRTGDVLWQQGVPEEPVGSPACLGSEAWLATRSHLHVLDLATGKILSSIAAIGGDWLGVVPCGNRIVATAQKFTCVIDPTNRAILYQIATSRQPTVHQVGGEVWAFDGDRTVQTFTRLR